MGLGIERFSISAGIDRSCIVGYAGRFLGSLMDFARALWPCGVICRVVELKTPAALRRQYDLSKD